MSNYLLNQSPFYQRSGVPTTFADIFDNFFSFEKENITSSLPLCNIEADEEQIKITAELPGVKKENLSITLEEKNLVLKGTRDALEIDGKPLIKERFTGCYERVIALPYQVEEGSIEAKLKDGVLTIDLKRLEESKPKAIEIKIN